MDFIQWQARAEEITGFSGHGSRKRIAEFFGITSETIKKSEKADKVSIKMMKTLRDYEDDPQNQPFEKLMGEAGRWNIGKSNRGVLVTHIQPPFAFTAAFTRPDEGQRWEDMETKLSVYNPMSDSQLAVLVDEAREIAAKSMGLIDIEAGMEDYYSLEN
jgi:hypothetical protein